MKKTIIILMIITISIFSVYSQQWESVLELSFGDKQQQVGLEDWPEGLSSVTNIIIDKNNFLYIADARNDRILVFNNKLKFHKEIRTKDGYLDSNRKMLIDEDLNIWVLFNSRVFKMDNSGKLLIDSKEVEKIIPYLPNHWHKLQLYNKKIFVKDRKGKFYGIDEEGKNLLETKMKESKNNALNDLAMSRSVSQDELKIIQGIDEKVRAKSDKIKSFVDEKGILYSADRDEYKEYAKIQRNVKKENNTSRSNIEFKGEPYAMRKIPGTKYYDGGNYFGTDKNHNTYWICSEKKVEVIQIFDKFGQLLKELDIKELEESQNVDMNNHCAIDQKGNIYYAWMHSDVGFRLYQYTRDW